MIIFPLFCLHIASSQVCTKQQQMLYLSHNPTTIWLVVDSYLTTTTVRSILLLDWSDIIIIIFIGISIVVNIFILIHYCLTVAVVSVEVHTQSYSFIHSRKWSSHSQSPLRTTQIQLASGSRGICTTEPGLNAGSCQSNPNDINVWLFFSPWTLFSFDCQWLGCYHLFAPDKYIPAQHK